MTTILELCRDAADELSVIRPSMIGPDAPDPTAQKLFRHLTRTCRQLAKRHDWQVLRREMAFVTSGVEAQIGAIPADFLRFVPGTMFNRTRRTKVLGPLTPVEWQRINATVYTSVYDQFIQRGNAVLFTGSLTPGQEVAYEYITKNIGRENGDEIAAFTGDDNTTLFDDELVVSGVVWRYLKAEGSDYAEEFREHELILANSLKMDGGRRVLDMGSDMRSDVPPASGDTIVDMTSV